MGKLEWINNIKERIGPDSPVFLYSGKEVHICKTGLLDKIVYYEIQHVNTKKRQTVPSTLVTLKVHTGSPSSSSSGGLLEMLSKHQQSPPPAAVANSSSRLDLMLL